MPLVGLEPPDLDLEADALEGDAEHDLPEEDGDSAYPCVCDCEASAHRLEGCGTTGCACLAAWDGGEGIEAEDLEADQIAQRVAVERAAAVSRRKNRDPAYSPQPPAGARLTGRYPTEDEISYGLSLESEALAVPAVQ
jgi:hypothetical protein